MFCHLVLFLFDIISCWKLGWAFGSASHFGLFPLCLFMGVCRKAQNSRGEGKKGDRQRVYHVCTITEQQEQQTELEGGVSDKSCRHCSLTEHNEQPKTKEEGESTERKTQALCLLIVRIP